ncbi:ATP-binding protein [Flavobacterium antarcticum]|uniref:tetratricopeptide repeat-containing sensor histidine kinase n=1 Tax=Flavobacterium antarcticum TaxID=271155 RepID=UPI0003B415F5|nr:ATP-binding protein [Flavobacterium antarcticum]
MTRSLIFALFLLVTVVSCQKEVKSVVVLETKNNELATQFSALGDSHYAAKKFDSAYYYYNKSKELFELANDSSYVAYTLIQLARIQQTFSDYGSSEETLTEVLPYIEHNLPYQNATNNLFGIAAKELKNYTEALAYYNSALVATTDPILRVSPLNNIAVVYIEQERYSEAIALLSPLVHATLLDQLPDKKALVMDNLGFAYAKYAQGTKGLELMNQALALRKKLADSYGSIESYLHLADFYKDTHPQESNKNALLAYKVARLNNSLDERLEALALLMTSNEKGATNTYASQFLHLNDSVKKVNNNAKYQFAKIKYDARKTALENSIIKGEQAATLLQLERQKNQKNISFFSFILLLIGTLYALNYYKRKNKRERLASSYATETRISKALHDELANDVFYVLNFAETQDLQQPPKKEILLAQLDKIYGRTRNFSKENSPIDTGVAFEADVKQMLSSYKCSATEIIIKNGQPIDWFKVAPEKKIALYRVLQELMINMKKYSQAGFVVVGFDRDQHGIQIDYSDNGVGFSEKLIFKNGLQNAENRIQAVNGILTFESEPNKGFRAKILLPK